ncbi:MAG: hypothetical protein WC360_09000 [Opitutales bacterium]|jgi:hypothetical protein
MKTSSMTGSLTPTSILVDLARIITACFIGVPDNTPVPVRVMASREVAAIPPEDRRIPWPQASCKREEI